MANSLLERLEGLVSRFEEVSTLITDPNVIADQKRYVKLTKEYKDLGKIVDARKEYVGCLQNISDAKEMLAIEDDPETKEMLREELSASEQAQVESDEHAEAAKEAEAADLAAEMQSIADNVVNQMKENGIL